MGERSNPLAVEKTGEKRSKEESIQRTWERCGKNTVSEETSSASVTGEKGRQQNEEKKM